MTNRHEIECKVQARIPSEFGTHRLLLYRLTANNSLFGNGNVSDDTTTSSNSIPESEHEALCLVFGNYQSQSLMEKLPHDTEQTRMLRGCNIVINKSVVKEKEAPLVRIHSCCFTGETLGSTRCDCAEQLHQSMHLISKNPNGGIIIYLKQEGRGIGLLDKLLCYNLIDNGYDTLSANNFLGHKGDLRSYEQASQILEDLGVRKVRILTNNPDKVESIRRFGIEVESRIEMKPQSWQSIDSRMDREPEQGEITVQDRDYYLKTKVERMGHLLDIPSVFKTLNK